MSPTTANIIGEKKKMNGSIMMQMHMHGGTNASLNNACILTSSTNSYFKLSLESCFPEVSVSNLLDLELDRGRQLSLLTSVKEKIKTLHIINYY